MDTQSLEESYFPDKYGMPRWHVKRQCFKCNKDFWVRKDLFLNRGSGRYCSIECRNNDIKAPMTTFTCDGCGKQVQRRTRKLARNISKSGYRFCSNECKNNNIGVGKLIQPPHFGTAKVRKRKQSPDGRCLNCKKDLRDRRYAFCSHECWSSYNYNEYIRKWKNKEVSGNRNDEESLSVLVRRYMLEKAGHKCSKCGWCEVNLKTGKIPLTINHIDGNHKNSYEDNLEVLCPNCHSLTPNYGSLNKGNGRKNRLRGMYIKGDCSINVHGDIISPAVSKLQL
jgi:hypothetical protein